MKKYFWAPLAIMALVCSCGQKSKIESDIDGVWKFVKTEGNIVVSTIYVFNSNGKGKRISSDSYPNGGTTIAVPYAWRIDSVAEDKFSVVMNLEKGSVLDAGGRMGDSLNMVEILNESVNKTESKRAFFASNDSLYIGSTLFVRQKEK